MLAMLGGRQSFVRPLLNQAFSFLNSLRRAGRSESKLDLLLAGRVMHPFTSGLNCNSEKRGHFVELRSPEQWVQSNTATELFPCPDLNSPATITVPLTCKVEFACSPFGCQLITVHTGGLKTDGEALKLLSWLDLYSGRKFFLIFST